jgi:hypothetical protein
MSDNTSWIDAARSACLCDVGQPHYLAATTIATDGTEHLPLAKHDALTNASTVLRSGPPTTATLVAGWTW